jgi:photosystem II stability/assembly factor-like uncharacterized protein
VKESMPESVHRYPGAQPFRDDEVSRQVFFGRNKDSAALADQILANRLVIVYAKSGSGKTSLLNAGVAPRLREAGCVPLFVRTNDVERGATTGVLEGIRTEAKRQQLEFSPGDSSSLWAFFKTTEFWHDDLLLTPVLILDQFEELFTLQGFESRDQFLTELGALLRGIAPPGKDAPPPGMSAGPPALRVVLSLREDFLGLLEEASDQIPEIMDHRFRLAPLNAESARIAITGPAALEHGGLATRSFALEPQCVDAIINYLGRSASRRDSARSRQVEPFHLQLICQYIENVAFAKQKNSGEQLRLGLADIGGEKAMADTLKTFYSNAIGSIPKQFRKAAGKMCEQFLISSEGRRLSVEERELWRAASVPSEALRLLVERRLLRTDRRSDRTYYELGHDALVQPVLATRRRQAFLLFRIAIFAGAAVTVLATAALVVTLYSFFTTGAEGIFFALILSPVGAGFGTIGVLCLRSGSRRRARFSVQTTATDDDSPPARLPWYRLAFGWTMLVIGPAVALVGGVYTLICIGITAGNLLTRVLSHASAGPVGRQLWTIIVPATFTAFGWFLFQSGDRTLWPDEFSGGPAQWQIQVIRRNRLILSGTAKLLLGGSALTIASLGSVALLSCESTALRGVAAYLKFAGLYAPFLETCNGVDRHAWDHDYLGLFSLVTLIGSVIFAVRGSQDLRSDFRFRRNILRTSSSLPQWTIGAVIGLIALVNFFVWSKINTASVKNEGWVSVSNSILHSADGGRTWTRLGDTPEPLNSLAFTSSLSGWGVGPQGLWNTGDGGVHWTLKLPHSKDSGYPRAVRFASPQLGFCVWTSPSKLLRTTNGGKTWDPVAISSSLDLDSMFIAISSPHVLWLLSDSITANPSILRSIDDGATWTSIAGPGIGPFYALSFANAETGWAASSGGSLARTSNGGQTWILQKWAIDEQQNVEFFRVEALTPGSAVAVGSIRVNSAHRYSYLIRTDDAGKTWVEVPDFCCQDLVELSFVSPTTGWTASHDGHVFHTEDGGRSWTLELTEKGEVHSIFFRKP